MANNTETHWLLAHGAKVILGVMILGAVTYVGNLTATVWNNRARIDKIEPKVESLETIIKNRSGHYCHALEVNDTYELDCIVEQIMADFPDLPKNEYLDFFQSMEVYALNEENENEIFNYDFNDFIENNL